MCLNCATARVQPGDRHVVAQKGEMSMNESWKDFNDPEFIRGLKARDHGAWNELVVKKAKELRGIAQGVGLDRDLAGECVQNVLAKAFKSSIDNVKEGGNLRGWLAKSVINAAIGEKKHQSRHQTGTVSDNMPCAEPSVDPDQGTLVEVENIVGHLGPISQRSLKDSFEGISDEEAARRDRVSRDVVRKRRSRAVGDARALREFGKTSK